MGEVAFMEDANWSVMKIYSQVMRRLYISKELCMCGFVTTMNEKRGYELNKEYIRICRIVWREETEEEMV